MQECPFCLKEGVDVLMQNKYAKAILDNYPVSKGHILIVPKRHVNKPSELSSEEMADVLSLVKEAKGVMNIIAEPDGYNVGINIGKAAGQTVEHMHVHVIPRYQGDMDDPTGGVRGVIPEKRTYNKE